MYQVQFARTDASHGDLYNVVDQHGAICRAEVGLALATELAAKFTARDADWADYYAAVAKTDSK